MSRKHSALPWMVEPINNGYTYQITTSQDTGFDVIGETPDGLEIDEANAAFIVRVCNSHYELLEAVDEALDQMANYDDLVHSQTEDEPEYYEEWSAVLNKLRAINAKARSPA